ncbi:mitochondrial ribosomal protein L32 isoform X1 [Amblyomma americanum]|uniref:Large ribosomal subunit protein bL32m n=1 Tax=Amblyomma americanum TaxID=6943 RepID=A0A0C9SCP2_AMBAM
MAMRTVVDEILKLSDALFNAAARLGCLSRPHPAAFCPVGLPNYDIGQDKGIVWAVPTRRVSLERRMMRRIAHPFFKIKPKDYIKSCHVCGHFHLAHTICGRCYQRVKEETEQMRDAIAEELKLDPVESEVTVVYKGEKPPESGTRVVEVDRPRPAWFSQNLLTRSSSS